MGMYKSPIEFIYGQMQAQLEGDVIKAVQNYGINVDKDELIRALRFDRDMYYKGYADGEAEAMQELVRCKDCAQWHRNCGIVDSPNGHCFTHDIEMNGFDFCSYGERKDNERKNV